MRSATLSPAALRWQKGMVVGQAALSVVILGAATLVGLSFRNVQHVPSGFAAEGAIVARVQLDGAKYADSVARSNLGRALIDNLEHEPAIAAASFSSTLPVSDPGWVTFFHIAMPDGSLSKDQVLFNIRRVSPGYLKTLGIPLLTGRQFDAHDDERSPNVAIVSRALAERAWPGESAIGKRIYRVVPGSTQPSALTVVGVVGSVTDAGATAPPGETVYIPWSQLSVTRLSIVVRARGSDEAAVSAIRHSLRAVDPLLAAHHVAKLDTLLDDAHALQRLQSVLLLTFAVGAMLMAMLGCYGVMTQLVTTREREYALRLVFGASAAELGRSVIHQVAWLTVPGVLVGSLGMIPLAGVIKRFVFGIDPKSPALLAAVAASVLGIALVAALPSVIRAMRTDVRRAMTS
jgi:putative ABC transport system permease protein